MKRKITFIIMWCLMTVFSLQLYAQDWEASIPYWESFDDAEHYSGDSQVPIGWLSVGDNPFITANSRYVPAHYGEYYAVTLRSMSARNDNLYTPLLEMKAGKTYRVSFYLYMPGGMYKDRLKFTVGQDQDREMQTVLLDDIRDKVFTDWTLMSYEFTPDEDAMYSFAFQLCSEHPDCGMVAIDDFMLTDGDDIVLPPVADFVHGPFYFDEMGYCNSMVWSGQKVTFYNRSDGAASVEWSVNGTPMPADDQGNLVYTFKDSGLYEFTLKVSNKGGEDQISKKYDIAVFDDEMDFDMILSTNDYAQDEIFQRSGLPAFLDGQITYYSEDVLDYAVGVNHYYRKVAERFEVAEGNTVSISTLTYTLLEYYLFQKSDDYTDMNKEVTISIYGETDGRLDPTKVYATKRSKMFDVYGSTIYQPLRVSLVWDEPVEITGSFYVALEFDEMTLDPVNTVMPRSEVGLDSRRHASGETTLYVCPDSIPGGSFKPDGGWYRADQVHSDMTGFSFGVLPWVRIVKSKEVGIEPHAVTASLVYDDSYIYVTADQPDMLVRIYNISGQIVYSGSVSDELVICTSGWSKGIYIVCIGDRSYKVIR